MLVRLKSEPPQFAGGTGVGRQFWTFSARIPNEARLTRGERMDVLTEGRSVTPQAVTWGFTPAILLSVVLNPLNSATISVGLEVLLTALHSGSSGITWIVSGYYLGSAVAQPIMGTLGDRLGYRKFLYVGLALVLLTAVLAPLSHNLWIFVAWRVVQAVGTSMVFPNAIGLVRRWQQHRMPLMLGWIGMAAGIALAVGPALGGLLIADFGWQAIFWLNIPIALAAGVLLWLSVPDGGAAQATVSRGWDLWGSSLFSMLMVLLLLWSTGAVPAAMDAALGTGAAAVLVLLITVESRQARPVIPVRWFKHPIFSVAGSVTVVTNLVMYIALYGIPVWLETRRHLSVTASGFMLLIFAGTMALASPVGGRAARRRARRMPVLIASGILVVASLILWLQNRAPILWVGVALALLGLSFAVSNVLLQQVVLELAPASQAGSASGLYSLLRYVGTMASSVVIADAFKRPSSIGILYASLVGASSLSFLLSFLMPRYRAVKDPGQ